MLTSDLCDHSGAYIVKRRISVIGNNNANRKNKKLTFTNNTPIRSCLSKIDKTFIENAEDLNIFMPMYNLLEYSEVYSIISGRLWNYFRDQVNEDSDEFNDDDFGINN